MIRYVALTGVDEGFAKGWGLNVEYCVYPYPSLHPQLTLIMYNHHQCFGKKKRNKQQCTMLQVAVSELPSAQRGTGISAFA